MRYLLIIAAAVLLAGCGEQATEGEPVRDTHLVEYHPTLKDGRSITCLAVENGNRGGLSCDWASEGEYQPVD